MNFELARENMVEGQIRPSSVTRPELVEAMRRIPREIFIPSGMATLAYIDEDLDLGAGRFLMEPTTLARLIQATELKADDLVLDIGCGTGYSTALLASLVNTVVAVDSSKEMIEAAEKNLGALDICNAALFHSDHKKGFAQQAPYDVIFINGMVGEIPRELGAQLATNGRLVCVLARAQGKVGCATLFEKHGETVSSRPLFDAAVPFLAGFERKQEFVF